jgi:hypothetical protein
LSALLLPCAIGAHVACSSDPPPAKCSTTADVGCAPLYEPTFDQVFTRTLKPTCAKSGASCHASTGKQGGLVFEDADTAYRLLMDRGVARAADPACATIVHRVTATDGNVRMPPGLSLPASEQCAIFRWVADGAKR